ncbi:1-acyl-sn-glycerol-3-phosphate acyltransferase [Streptomyces sp. NPDC051315]|uniref:1-acyl-sn-glycerol-3-phosphate acyltransferase n=1 Tax=Streptomyces sp. NPDC051315 TaxID=3365650 RepID=UPI0037A06EB8
MSAWLPTAPCTPRACVEEAGSATAAPRAVLRLTAVVLLVLTGVLLSPLGRGRPRSRGRIPAGAVPRWSRAVVRAAGVRVRTTGTAAPVGGLLLVANHISWLDIPLLAAVRPARMLAKAEIRRWPVAGALAARGGVLFIDRDRLRALPGTVARIAGALRAGRAVAVFPEGSTWCGRAQGHFRRAVFQAALDAGVPVQPVRIRYRYAGGAASTAPAFVGDDTLLASLWRVVRARGLVAEVETGPVIAPEDHPDRASLAAAAAAWALGAPGGVPRETSAARAARWTDGVHAVDPVRGPGGAPHTATGRARTRVGVGGGDRPPGVSPGDRPTGAPHGAPAASDARPVGAGRGDRPPAARRGHRPVGEFHGDGTTAGLGPEGSRAVFPWSGSGVGAAPEASAGVRPEGPWADSPRGGSGADAGSQAAGMGAAREAATAGSSQGAAGACAAPPAPVAPAPAASAPGAVAPAVRPTRPPAA